MSNQKRKSIDKSHQSEERREEADQAKQELTFLTNQGKALNKTDQSEESREEVDNIDQSEKSTDKG